MTKMPLGNLSRGCVSQTQTHIYKRNNCSKQKLLLVVVAGLLFNFFLYFGYDRSQLEGALSVLSDIQKIIEGPLDAAAKV